MVKNPCAKCGSCTSVCPVYQVTGRESLTARGRINLLEKLAGDTPSREYIEIFSRCLLCNACSHNCPRGIDLPSMVIEARSTFPLLTGSGSFKKQLLEKCLASDTLLKSLAALLKLSKPLLEQIPASSGLRLKLGIMTGGPTPVVARQEHVSHAKNIAGQVLLFKGCLATHLYPEIASTTEELITGEQGLKLTTPAQHCCGLASFSSGNLETAKDLARRNIDAFGDNDTPILTTCASCYSHLSSYPDLLENDPEWAEKAKSFAARVSEISSFLSHGPRKHPETLATSGKKLRVLYHDPCHLRFRTGDFQSPPRRLLASLPGVELVELPRGPKCCGLGGLFNLAHPDLSANIGGQLVSELKQVQPDVIVSTCSGCLLQLKLLVAQEEELHSEVCHLTELVNRRKAGG